MYAKDFHVSIKDLHICANNPALEDFVIQNHCKKFLRTYAKKTSTSLLRICVYAKIIQRWKTFLFKITLTYEKKTTKVSKVAKIRNRYNQVSIKAMLCVYMRK